SGPCGPALHLSRRVHIRSYREVPVWLDGSLQELSLHTATLRPSPRHLPERSSASRPIRLMREPGLPSRTFSGNGVVSCRVLQLTSDDEYFKCTRNNCWAATAAFRRSTGGGRC